MSLRDKQRVIYTTPIKALSNQKYRELFEEFQDVGLMTGDVTINPSASCLVMTTEVRQNVMATRSKVTCIIVSLFGHDSKDQTSFCSMDFTVNMSYHCWSLLQRYMKILG